MSYVRLPVYHVEVCLKSHGITSIPLVKDKVLALFNLNPNLLLRGYGKISFESDEFLQANEGRARVLRGADVADTSNGVSLQVHVFQLNKERAEEEIDETENVAMFQQWALPCHEFDGLWESLVYDHAIKRSLLDYVTTAMLFSDRKVNANLISWSRVVLLHGPPGTGKTSLCRALAQKLAIRLFDRHPQGQLLEINAHSLFSKWFSESGKFVMRLFARIRELAEDPKRFVCVLIDEVESLTAARRAALNGSEPSDAIRVVNAVLTQLDQLKSFPNVLVLTTSNITEAIDLAFVDRADIKQFIGPPSLHARYQILSSCLQELMRVGIIQSRAPFLEPQSVELLQSVENEATRGSLMLWEIAKKCENFRYLRTSVLPRRDDRTLTALPVTIDQPR